MQLFDLPQELVVAIFEAITLTRSLVRLLRLRRVSRHFKFFVEHVLIYARPFPQLGLDTLTRPWRIDEGWRWRNGPPHPFYLELLARRTAAARQPSCSLGRIRHTAVVLYEMAGDTGHEALVGTLKSLCHLSCSYRVSWRFNERLFSPKFGLAVTSSDSLEADLCVAAIYLGRRAHVESLIAQGWTFCDWKSEKDVRSGVFGSAFAAATLRGDVSMMRLLLSSNRNYSEDIPYYLREQILDNAVLYGHRDAFDFAIDGGPLGVNKDSQEISKHIGHGSFEEEYERIRKATFATPIVDNYRRGASILLSIDSTDPEIFAPVFHYSASAGRLDMVRYCLDPGARGSQTGFRKGDLTHSLHEAVRSGNLDVVSLLLRHGADPNQCSAYVTPLKEAIRSSSTSIARLLLDFGAKPNFGDPAPIVIAVSKEDETMSRLLLEYGARVDRNKVGVQAMHVAKLLGFESMIDMLVEQGVERDAILKSREVGELCNINTQREGPFGGRNPKYYVPRKPRSYAR
ncbi:ankyrin repeat-containing domain protein [Xylaria sp. FL0933]|nr:ankyrin repeat-containing domain protein [Xylaria sp. FL0933]